MSGLEKIQKILRQYNSPEYALHFFKHLGYPVHSHPIEFYWEDFSDRAQKPREFIEKIYQISNIDNRFRIYHFHLKTDKFRRTDFRQILEPIYRNLPQANYLFVFTNNSDIGELAFVSPLRIQDPRDSFKVRLHLRTLITNRNFPYRTDLEVLEAIRVDGEGVSADDIWKKHVEAFSVQRVTDKFFKDYRKVFRILMKYLSKFSDDESWTHDYALQLLNRIMFLYFIQKKGWLLGPDGTTDNKFLLHFWQAYRDSGARNKFFTEWLNVLFFEVFNNRWQRRSEYLKRFPEWILDAFTRAPYLNGGLYSENDLDRKMYGTIPDEFFELIFEKWLDGTEPGFFERYNFTVVETTRFDEEVAVDPEMIGKVYESLVNITFEESQNEDRRGEAGIFYTPRTEIDLMCRLSIVDYLSNHLGGEYKPDLYQWVFAYDESEKEEADKNITKKELWGKLNKLLRDVVVLDPACGSGSFLVGMLLVLDDLQARCNKVLDINETPYERRKRIIGQSLYGVDVMDWAVHVAELRLWLQLVIETELDWTQLKLKPLLPNLSFKIRQGDSLLQEVGGVSFNIHSRQISLSASIRKKIKDLQKKKLDFYKGEPSPKITIEIEREERKIFEEILIDRFNQINNKFKELQREINQKTSDLYGGNEKLVLDEKKIEKYRLDMDLLINEAKFIAQALKEIQQEKRKIFVWDIAFVEIFEGEKKGFDIVIGNPPYVRQEKIKDPQGVIKDKSEYKKNLMKNIYLTYPNFFGYSLGKALEGKKPLKTLDGRSDYYIYFYFVGLSLLNSKGTFCFITSNSWLDVEFGRQLQEFLLKHGHIKLIIDNQKKRSFVQADINTIIALLSTVNDKIAWGLEKTARFVNFKVPFEEILSPVIWWEIEETKDKRVMPEFRCIAKKQSELLEEGSERDNRKGINIYTGNKLGGKYLKAPDIYFTILEKGKDKLVRLGDIAEVKRGFTTGANEFFYLQLIRNPEDFPICRVCGKIHKPEEGLVPVKNKAGWEGYIEKDFLRPVVKSPQEIRTYQIQIEDLKFKVFLCNLSKKKLKEQGKIHALHYIEWGESKGFHKRSTVEGRKLWWRLPVIMSKLIWIKGIWNRHFIPLSPVEICIDQQLYAVLLKDKNSTKVVSGILNSSYVPIFQELLGRANFGEGILWIAVYEPLQLYILDPSCLTFQQTQQLLHAFKQMATREIKSIFEELGLPKPNKDLSNINPDNLSLDNVMPDRRALDKVIFEALGLTEEEQLEVYKAVVELVKQRLAKARSI